MSDGKFICGQELVETANLICEDGYNQQIAPGGMTLSEQCCTYGCLEPDIKGYCKISE